MNAQEWHRLKGFWEAKRNAPYTNNVGRAHAKGRAKGVGQVLKKSFVKGDIHLERVFSQY